MFANFEPLGRLLSFHSRVTIFIFFLASLILLTTVCVLVTQNIPESEFQSVLGIRTDPKLRLRAYYKGAPDDPIGVAVTNHTDKTVFFQNELLGLRAYRYDVSKKTWVVTPIEPEILHPNEPIMVSPQDAYPFVSGIFEPWVVSL